MSSSFQVEEFYRSCRAANAGLPDNTPEAWAFGATPQLADELLALVQSGVKTATASSLWDYEAAEDPVPKVGELSIILDGRGIPRVLIETTSMEVMPFEEVPASHAHAEGEGDRTLKYWREVHEHYWRTYSESPRGFEPGMPVVCEQFQVLHGVD